MNRRHAALALGIFCHLLFLVSVSFAMVSLLGGFAASIGPVHGAAAFAWDMLLIAQFPVFHSFFLGAKGRKRMAALFPGDFGRDMVTTSFVAFASLQLLCTFLFWSPIGPVWWSAEGSLLTASLILYGCSWILLGISMCYAGLPIQMGFLGWYSIFKDRRPNYPTFPKSGPYRICRHPVYLAFALILWTGPVWGPDHLLLAVVWGAYCLIGPRFKERRLVARHGAEYEAYRRTTPYFLPRFSLLTLRRKGKHDFGTATVAVSER